MGKKKAFEAEGVEVKEMPLASLIIDGYQRGPQLYVQALITMDPQPLLFNRIIVNERDDGTRAVLDGQQRRAGLMKAGYTHAPGLIFRYPVAEEGPMYIKLNMDRKKLSTHDQFKAALFIQEDWAVSLQAIAQHHGFRFGRDTGQLSAYNSFRLLHEEQMAGQLFEFATLVGAQPGRSTPPPLQGQFASAWLSHFRTPPRGSKFLSLVRKRGLCWADFHNEYHYQESLVGFVPRGGNAQKPVWSNAFEALGAPRRES